MGADLQCRLVLAYSATLKSTLGYPKGFEYSITSRDICDQLLAGDVPVNCLPRTFTLSCKKHSRRTGAQARGRAARPRACTGPHLCQPKPWKCAPSRPSIPLRGPALRVLVHEQRFDRRFPSCSICLQQPRNICPLAALSLPLQVGSRLCKPLHRSSRAPARTQRARQLQPQAVAPSSPELHGRQHPHRLGPKARGQLWRPVLPAQEHIVPLCRFETFLCCAAAQLPAHAAEEYQPWFLLFAVHVTGRGTLLCPTGAHLLGRAAAAAGARHAENFCMRRNASLCPLSTRKPPPLCFTFFLTATQLKTLV